MSISAPEERALSVLVYGYGNPGRGDDGLGVAFASAVGQMGYAGVRVECGCQLDVEDSLTIRDASLVIFVDASRNQIGPYRFSRCVPACKVDGTTTHAMTPASVLSLCQEVYGVSPEGYLLEIRGANWEMSEGLSAEALVNFHQALAFLGPLLASPALEDFRHAANVAK